MNKKIIILLISILIIAVIGAFYFLKPKPVKTITTEIYNLVDSQFLSTADTTRGILKIDLSVEVPETFENQEVLAKIKSTIFENLFGEVVAGQSSKEILNQYSAALKSEYLKNNADFANKLLKESKLVFNNSIILEGFSLINDAHIFSYGISRQVDLGGSYPSGTRYYLNFSLETGEKITEQDIFIAGYESELIDLIKEQIIIDSKISDDDEIPSIQSFEESNYIVENIKPNGNFFLNEEAICYVFNPYEISPVYFPGETEVAIPYSKIKHLMKENNPIVYLVNIPVK
jgi:hypothetical protein